MKEPKDKRTTAYKEWKLWQNTQKIEVNVEQEQPATGLGDVLEKVLEHPAVKPVTNIVKKLIFKDGKDCDCNDRKEKLNAILPRRFKAAKCLTEDEHKAWGLFVKERTLKIERVTIVMVCKLYSRIFQRQYYEPCGGCSPKILIHMIDKLDTVYNSYEK